MLKKSLSVSLPILAILGAGFWIYRSQFAGSQMDVGPYEAVGVIAAEETFRLVDKQSPVTVIAPQTADVPNPPLDAQINAFQQTLKKSGLATVTMRRFQLAPQERMATGGAVPVETFLAAAQEPGAGAVVLFCAFPQLTVPQKDLLKRGGKKVVVISGNLPGYKNLLQAGVFHRAIVPRMDMPPTAPAGGTPRQIFDAQFEIITPENVAGR